MSYLVEKPDGSERVWTPSLSGYEDWTLIREGAGTKPKDFQKLVANDWQADADRRTRVERKARFVAMDREELVDFLLAVIKKGDARLDAAEARIAALESKAPAP